MRLTTAYQRRREEPEKLREIKGNDDMTYGSASKAKGKIDLQAEKKEKSSSRLFGDSRERDRHDCGKGETRNAIKKAFSES